MTDLYLIAHKVRGEPAFDVAHRMQCPLCDSAGCHECDSLGYWWIIPTSGHRAYPWWNVNLLDIDDTYELAFNLKTSLVSHPGPMPPNLPDHYQHSASPSAPRVDLLSALGLNKPAPAAPAAPIHRRF